MRGYHKHQNLHPSTLTDLVGLGSEGASNSVGSDSHLHSKRLKVRQSLLSDGEGNTLSVLEVGRD